MLALCDALQVLEMTGRLSPTFQQLFERFWPTQVGFTLTLAAVFSTKHFLSL